MASKTEYEVDKSINAYVKDEETLRQMQTDGQLKPFSNYYTPDEDGSNGNYLEFVGNYSATTTISIDIDLVNYDYFVFSSMEITATGNMGFFFSQGLTWTVKRAGNDGSVDNTLSGRSYAYLAWGRAMSSVNYIRYDGTKTLIQSGFPALSGFSYATGKPTRLTFSTDAGNIVQSYITLFRRKK